MMFHHKRKARAVRNRRNVRMGYPPGQSGLTRAMAPILSDRDRHANLPSSNLLDVGVPAKHNIRDCRTTKMPGSRSMRPPTELSRRDMLRNATICGGAALALGVP